MKTKVSEGWERAKKQRDCDILESFTTDFCLNCESDESFISEKEPKKQRTYVLSESFRTGICLEL